MRFYDLDINGKIKGSYAVPQPGRTLYPIKDAPDHESKRDGVPGTAWVPDMDIVNARLVEAARIAAKKQSLADNLPSWATVDAAVTSIANLADAKAFIRKLTRVVYWLARDRES